MPTRERCRSACKNEPAPQPAELNRIEPEKPQEEPPISKLSPAPVELKHETPAPAGVTALRDKLKQGARLYFEGNFDGAIASLKSILQMDTQNASANFLIGCAYASKYLLAPETSSS